MLDTSQEGVPVIRTIPPRAKVGVCVPRALMQLEGQPAPGPPGVEGMARPGPHLSGLLGQVPEEPLSPL